MNAHLLPAPGSWLSHTGSAATVLGPSHGHTPDIGAYRIAYAHLSPHSLWLFGSVTDMPPEAEVNGARGEVTKFNLALDIALRRLVRLSGQPALDPKHDDSMHGFELAMPVALSVSQTDQLVWPEAKHHVLHLVAESAHFGFELFAEFIHAFGGKHAKTRFAQALSIRT